MPKNLTNFCLIAGIVFLNFEAVAQSKFSSPDKDKKILYSVIDQFQKECTHVYTVDQNVIDNLQAYYLANKSSMSKEQLTCYDTYMSQMRGVFVIYKQTCEEVSRPNITKVDSELARLFVNIRTYLTSFRVTHKTLNGCLIRSGVKESNLVQLSDYAVGTKQVFQSLHLMEVEPPFKEERVTFR